MDCETSHLPLDQILRSMIRVSGALTGLPIVEVGEDTHTENAMNCGNNHITLEELLKLCIGTDASGKTAFRVKVIASSDLAINCSNNNDVDHFFKNMFAYDSTLGTYAVVLNKSV